LFADNVNEPGRLGEDIDAEDETLFGALLPLLLFVRECAPNRLARRSRSWKSVKAAVSSRRTGLKRLEKKSGCSGVTSINTLDVICNDSNAIPPAVMGVDGTL
jgi:hypothetical protein